MVCYESTVIYRHDPESINVCTDPEHLDTIVVYKSPTMFKVLVDYFDTLYDGFADFIKLIIKNDLEKHFIGTHSEMDRTLSRLYKLRYIISQQDIKTYPPIEYEDLFKCIVEDYDRILNALSFFKESFHRVRDRVHELIYPIIRKTLERFLYVRVYYKFFSNRGDEVYIKCEFEYPMYRKPEVECRLVRGDDVVRKLSTNDVYEILDKQIRRKISRIDERSMEKLIWEFLDGKWHHDPMDDLLELVNVVLDGGMQHGV